MLLSEYTPKRAERLNVFAFNEIVKPYKIKILWLRIINNENKESKIFEGEHSHSFFEVHFVLDGVINYEYNGEVISAAAQHGLFISPDVPHKYIKKDNGFIKLAFAFTVDEGSEFFARLSLYGFKKFKFDDGVFSVANSALELADSFNVFTSALLTSKALEIINLLTGYLKIQVGLTGFFSDSIDPRLSVAKEYIHHNKNSLISCEDVSRECGISVKQLNRIFEKHTGQTLFGYIINARLRYSEDLLLETDYTIKEISTLLGFENEYYFNNFFKRHCGMPPGYFRKQNAYNTNNDK